METYKCGNCHQDVKQNDNYCPECGKKLDWTDEEELVDVKVNSEYVCANCNSKIKNQVKYCPQCGSKLSWPDDKAENRTIQKKRSQSKKIRPEISKATKDVSRACMTAFIVFAVITAFSLFGGSGFNVIHLLFLAAAFAYLMPSINLKDKMADESVQAETRCASVASTSSFVRALSGVCMVILGIVFLVSLVNMSTTKSSEVEVIFFVMSSIMITAIFATSGNAFIKASRLCGLIKKYV